MSSRAIRLATLVIAVALLGMTVLVLAGCGGNKTGAISQEQFNRIQKGMTLDEVEAIAGNPYRTHSAGTAKDPNIIWNYSKTDGEGLVRISFLSGKVDTISPYEIGVQPEE